MISVLTLTYKRHHILEEAIESFLRQDINYPKEMVIINDNKDAEYIFDHPDVRIINLKDRFTSISEKLKWGFNQCKYDYIYRLDDDDLIINFKELLVILIMATYIQKIILKK